MVKRITVFTATYNRLGCLRRLYDSLLKQSFKDFEWVVIDDGSLDDTEHLIISFVKEKPFFEVKYKKTKNGGKHRAINKGIQLVNGELVLIMDSDDWLREDALEQINYYENTIPKNEKCNFAGVYGLKIHSNGNIVGKTFNGEYLDCTYLDRGKYGIVGDKCEVYYSDILKQFPFPEYEGETFCTECLVWDKIASQGLKIRFFNQSIYYCDYREDGLTKKGNLLYANNPKQYGDYVWYAFRYKKTNKFHASIKVYEYYLYERKKLKYYEIVNNLHMSFIFISLCICVQWFSDIFRFFIKKGRTVRKSVMVDIIRNEKGG